MKKKKRLLALALMLGMATIVGACEPNRDEPVDPGAPAIDPAEAPQSLGWGTASKASGAHRISFN